MLPLTVFTLACVGAALSSPSRSRPREGMKFNSQLREKFIYGHDDEPDYNTDHSAYQQEYTPQEYPSPSFDYSSSSSSADEKFMTSDPGSGFSFGGFSQTESKEGESEAQQEKAEEGEEPNMREFTLIISRLLFHLSQMQ